MAVENRNIEYRVRPVTRYIVTRYENGDLGSGAEQIGNEYDSAEVAYQVGYAVCKVEHEKLGWPEGDERIKYPDSPALASAHLGSIQAATLGVRDEFSIKAMRERAGALGVSLSTAADAQNHSAK